MPKPEINVTPLIDVLLVLLIIFMIVSPNKPSRFEARIPEPPADLDSVARDRSALVVEVKPDGTLIMNGHLKYDSFAELPKLTADIRKNLESLAGVDSENIRVFVKAPKSMAYGKVLRVIDSVKIAGIVPLSLQIDRLEN